MFDRYRMEHSEGRRFQGCSGRNPWFRGGFQGHQGRPGPWDRMRPEREGTARHEGRPADAGRCEGHREFAMGMKQGWTDHPRPDVHHGARRGFHGFAGGGGGWGFWGRRGGDEPSSQGPGGHGFRGPGNGGFGGGRHGGRGFGFGGGGRERLFDGGDLKLVILQLLADKPSYGYELIKTMEERLAGGYAPSPGVVYPTLTMLEEEGLATVSTSDAGKKVYTVTDTGQAELAANERRLAEIFERVEHAGRGFRRGRSPEIMRAFMSLRSAVQARVSREGLTAEQIAKMAEAIEAAARTIDAM